MHVEGDVENRDVNYVVQGASFGRNLRETLQTSDSSIINADIYGNL
jgi:glyceraldehyde-3-phosphate dehydrogenase/erythrose-4-phosphate dehydrogenase